MKAVLVIDEMPSRCLECGLVWDEMNNDVVRCSNGRRLDEYEDYIYKQKPNWCPLRPLPQKKNAYKFKDFNRLIENAQVEGWNACIDEILGETE